MSNKYFNKSISNEDVDEMKKFRQIIESGFSNDSRPCAGSDSVTARSSLNEGKKAIDTPNGPDADMVNFVNIMEGLYDGTVVEKLAGAAINNPELAEALDTSVTNNGVNVGKWQIRVRTDESRGKAKKYFDVAHTISKQVIAKNLCIYEAALALVRYLNNGKPINGSEIKNLLNLERNYHSHMIDALTYKVNSLKAEKRKEYDRSFILETRYTESKAKALRLEKKIQDLSKTSL